MVQYGVIMTIYKLLNLSISIDLAKQQPSKQINNSKIVNN